MNFVNAVSFSIFCDNCCKDFNFERNFPTLLGSFQPKWKLSSLNVTALNNQNSYEIHHKDMSKLIFRSQANPDGHLQPNRRPRTTVYGTLSQIRRSKNNKIGGQKIWKRKNGRSKIVHA